MKYDTVKLTETIMKRDHNVICPQEIYGYLQFTLTVSLCASLSCFQRHFYKPLLRRGAGKLLSQSAVFFASAFFHEVRCALITRCFKYSVGSWQMKVNSLSRVTTCVNYSRFRNVLFSHEQ